MAWIRIEQGQSKMKSRSELGQDESDQGETKVKLRTDYHQVKISKEVKVKPRSGKLLTKVITMSGQRV